MKRPLYQIFFPVLLILFIAPLCLAEQTSGPKIFFEETTFDAKEIKGTDYLEHAFKVLNKGDAPLELTDVKPG